MSQNKKPATWPQYAPYVAVFLWLITLMTVPILLLKRADANTSTTDSES